MNGTISRPAMISSAAMDNCASTNPFPFIAASIAALDKEKATSPDVFRCDAPILLAHSAQLGGD